MVPLASHSPANVERFVGISQTRYGVRLKSEAFQVACIDEGGDHELYQLLRSRQDRVEVDGDYLRVVGRQSDVISVGGENVYPTEIESVLQELPEVADATVRGVEHPITGQIVCAQVRWLGEETPHERRSRIKSYCSTRLNPYEIPAKIEFVDARAPSSPFKKRR